MTRKSATCRHCAGTQINLTGYVMDVEACHLVSNREALTLGSDLRCDLTVADPLVPRKALRLRHVKQHAGPKEACDAHWQVEAYPGVRFYHNDELTTRARLRFGDVLAVGCHRLIFTDKPDPVRNRRGNVEVQDLCARMIATGQVPAAFLAGRPSHLDRQRTRKALIGGAAAALLLLLLLLVPREKTFQPVQPPMEVVMIAEMAQAPSPDQVRSLNDVQRKHVETPPDDQQPAELQAPEVEVAQEDLRPIQQSPRTPSAPPVPPDKITLEEGPSLAKVTPKPNLNALEMTRQAEKLAPSAPRRRLTRAEANDPLVRRELSKMNVEIESAAPSESGFEHYAPEITRTAAKPGAERLALSREEQASLLAAMQPSPLQFENYRGTRIPVARIPEKLEELEMAQTPEEGIELDGVVSDAEVAASWKSGQFRLHAPGSPPPAEPPTYCYVSRVTEDGREYLYVSFVCTDPDVSQLRLNQGGGVWQDDSVEIFLDTNYNRTDYYHMVVNAQGKHSASYCPTGEHGINNRGSAWNVTPKIKTTINAEGKRWTAEILIPFDQVGGAPKEGDRWAVNFTRAFRGQSFPDSVYQNWFLVYDKNQTNYHHPELYGLFQW